MLLIVLTVILVLAIAVMTFVYFETFVKYLLIIFELFVVFMLLSVLFDTHYELRDDSLFMKGGLFRSEIAYKDIKTVARTRGYSFFMTLAINRLEINAGLDPEKGKIVLSPEREDEFLDELKKRCPDMVITQ